MDHGFVRVGAAVPVIKVADCKHNSQQIISLIEQAASKSVQILSFPEMCITGYTCGDLFHQKFLIDSAETALNSILKYSANVSLLCMVGMPVRVSNRLMNTAVVFQNGRILAVIPKKWIPNYGEFYEKRWFSSSDDVNVREITLCGQNVPFGTDILIKNDQVCVGVEICEDLWMPVPPSSYHSLNGANLLFNLSASNEIVAKNSYRNQLINQQSMRCIAAYVYASCGFGESTTDVVFAGNTQIVENGNVLKSGSRFSMENQLITADVDVQRLNIDRLKHTGFTTGNLPESPVYRYLQFELGNLEESKIERIFEAHPFVPKGQKLSERCEEIFSIQIQGLAQRLLHSNCKKAVVGVSGGLDSTLALLVTAKTFDKIGLPRENIIGITMPGFGTTDRTYNNAVNLIKELGADFREISITKSVLQHFEDIGQNKDIHDITYENSQARERTQILMDVANKENALVIGTGDLSELALGWATYNGDHMSMYGVNAGVPKTLVRFLVKWAAENQLSGSVSEVLKDVIDTPVSPELLPADNEGKISQKTEDIVGPYELHDYFIYYVLRFGFSPEKILWMAVRTFDGIYSKDVILKWLKVFFRRFFTQQFKRSCLPDGPKVGSVSLSPRGDWRMPSDASVQMWLDELDML